jgi:hypothetical protein
MKKAFITFILSTIPLVTSFSQVDNNQTPNGWEKYVHVEAGYVFPVGTIKESISIRQNISYYYVDQYSSGHISSTTSGLLLGIRYEYYLPRVMSGISTGLRFIGLNTKISGYTSRTSEFFYLRYSMQGSDTKFARVKSLTEDNYLFNVPLEIRFIPFQHKDFSLFAMAGLEFSIINLKKGADIKFQDDGIELHKNAILERISGPTNKNYSTFYSSVGVRLGQEGKPNYTLEVLLPSLLLTRNSFYLVDVDYFGGFKLSVQFPVKNNKPLDI